MGLSSPSLCKTWTLRVHVLAAGPVAVKSLIKVMLGEEVVSDKPGGGGWPELWGGASALLEPASLSALRAKA